MLGFHITFYSHCHLILPPYDISDTGLGMNAKSQILALLTSELMVNIETIMC